jgi:coenzyme F420 biosynthesis associated uncharacterized protein
MIDPVSPTLPPNANVRKVLAAGALGAGAVLSARVFLRPDTKAERRLIDWEVVRAVAVERCGEPPRGLAADKREQLGRTYDAMAAELAPLLSEVADRVPFTVPKFAALDRHRWIDVNITIVQRLLEPVEQIRAQIPESVVTALGRRAMDRYVGELFGLMSRRVLGQYDPVLSLGAVEPALIPDAALYLVEPNVIVIQRKHNVPGDSLRRWLILHELTHAWQFGEHPWLRKHIVSLMQEMLATGLNVEKLTMLRSRELLQRLPDTVRTQLRIVGRVQAIMSVLEGYSNFVMHRVGRKHVAHADELEAALRQRRQERTLLERLVFALTGLEMKMRQYEVGEKFCAAVVRESDLATLNRVWESAESMPTMDELKNPERWLARMRSSHH